MIPQAASPSRRTTGYDKNREASWQLRSEVSNPGEMAQQSAGGVRSHLTIVLICQSGLHCLGTLPAESAWDADK